MKKFSVLILLLLSSNLYSGNLPISSLAQILRPNDASGIALGLTGVSYNEGLFASYTNPAGLAFLNRIEAAFSHIPAMNMGNRKYLNQEAVGIGLPFKYNFSFALHYFNLNYGEVEVYDLYGNVKEKKNSGWSQLKLTCSNFIKIRENYFALGFNIKYFNQYFPAMNADVVWFDVGFRFKKKLKKNKYLSLGLSLSNIGNDLKHKKFTIDMPVRLMRAGITFINSELYESNLGISGTLEYQKNIKVEDKKNQWDHLGIGFELQFFKHLFGRVGYNFDLEDLSKDEKIEGITYGIGFITPEKLSHKVPIYILLSYGRGIKDYRDLDHNVITIQIGLDI